MAKIGLKHINYIKLSDLELIGLAQKGEQAPFTILFERYHHGVMAHINEILYNSDNNNIVRELSEQPQDICQETFNKAFLHIGSYNTHFQFSTWLYNIAKNATIDYIRRNVKSKDSQLLSQKSSQDVINSRIVLKDTPENNMIDSQEYEVAENAIRMLDEKYREAISLYALEGYGYEEIAEELGITISSAKVRVSRAKNKLSEILKDSPIAQKRAKKIKKGKQ